MIELQGPPQETETPLTRSGWELLPEETPVTFQERGQLHRGTLCKAKYWPYLMLMEEGSLARFLLHSRWVRVRKAE